MPGWEELPPGGGRELGFVGGRAFYFFREDDDGWDSHRVERHCVLCNARGLSKRPCPRMRCEVEAPKVSPDD